MAFLRELDSAMPAFQARAEALILRVPGEGLPALRADEEAHVLMATADRLAPIVQGWLRAVHALADIERGWGPAERAQEAGIAFNAHTEDILRAWDALLAVQPSTERMRRVLSLIHQGCYELYLSGPRSLWESSRDVARGQAEARLVFEPEAPALALATQELRRG
jgi:hypothetical protein